MRCERDGRSLDRNNMVYENETEYERKDAS